MKQSVAEKLISLLLVLILSVFSMGFAVLYSSATEYTADGVHSFYIGSTQQKGVIAEFNEDFTVLSVFTNGKKSNGIMKDWLNPEDEGYTYNPAYEHADTLRKVVFGEGIVNIGNYFLYECDKLTSVVFPQSLIRIGESSLRKTGLTSIAFPSKLKYIGFRAFSGCHSLKGDLVIPDSVAKVCDRAFYNCDGIDGSLYLGSSLTVIEPYAFCNCSKISGSLNLPSSLKSIGAYAFQSCERLSGCLLLNEGLEHIGDGAFNHCKGFTNTVLTIPSTLGTIGGDTAYSVDAYNVSLLDPPEPYCNHSSHVFYDFANTTLAEFSVSAENTHFTAVEGVLFTSDMKRLIAYPPSREGVSYEIPEGVEIIDEMAFGRTSYSSAQNKLKSITVPDSYIIKTNDDFLNTLNREAMCSLSSAIYTFTSIENIIIKDSNSTYKSVDGCVYAKDSSRLICVPAGKTGDFYVNGDVREISYGAFAGCNSLGYIVIPDTVEEISELSFCNCRNVNIIGYDGSAAVRFEGLNNCSVHRFGDLDDSGTVGLEDYSIIRNYISQPTQLSRLQSITGDYNLDLSIDGFDLFEVDKCMN